MTTTGSKSPSEQNTNNHQVKMPLKRFEIAFRKFSEVAIPMHLELLRKHKSNIDKYQILDEWDKVHVEQVNASRTVQQLTADIWEMERVRSQIREEDLLLVDKRLTPLKKQAMEAVQEFLHVHKEVSDPVKLLKKSNDEEDNPINELEPKIQEEGESWNVQQQTTKRKSLASSWRTLYTELLELNKLIHTYSHAVQTQQPTVDTIEDHLESTKENVDEGTRQLGKSVKLRTVMYPVAGALIGCLAGPVGLVVGLKVGLAAAVGGSAVGFLSGKYIQKRNQAAVETVEVELQQISKKNKDDNKSVTDEASA